MTVSQEAITAGADALHEAGCSDPACHYAMHATSPSDADRHIAEIVLEAAAPHLVAAEIAERVAERHAVHDDLALLLRVLGLGDHARPVSSHEVMLEAINEAGRLRAAVETGAADSCRPVQPPEVIRDQDCVAEGREIHALRAAVAAARRKAEQDCCEECGHKWRGHGPSGCIVVSRLIGGKCPCTHQSKESANE